MIIDDLNKLFEGVQFEIVRNKGQRTLRLSVSNERIRVSVPKSVPDKAVIEFVRQNEPWIRKSLKKQISRANHVGELKSRLNNEVFLRGIWKTFSVDESQTKIIETETSLVFPCPLSNINPSEIALNWQHTIAPQELVDRLLYWSEQLNISFKNVTIRNQKSKWGSCSSKGNISLNWRLIKTPNFVRDYIIVHELAHRKHMNHSDKFWTYLKSVYPRTVEAETWIKKHGKPAFIDP